MKIKTPFFILEIEWLFLIIFFIFIFSEKINNLLISFFVCYLFIVFHEFSHLFIASILGKEVETFKVTLAGVCIEFKKKKYCLCDNKISKKENFKNILIYFAGPISNILLSLIFYKNEMIFQINLFLAFINLLPIFPLDGFNILINVLELFNINNSLQKILLIFFYYIIYFILIFIGTMQLIIYKNISLMIFLIYLYLLKKINSKNEKMYKKYLQNTY